MSILSTFKKYKDYILTENGYQLSSRWTKSDAVVMGDGTDDTNTLERNLGAIKGITSDLACEDANVAASITAVSELNNNIEETKDILSANKFLDAIDITPYTTKENMFTCPSDGYLILCVLYGTSNYLLTTILGSDKIIEKNFGFGVNGHPIVGMSNAIFLKKGMNVWYRGGVGLNYAVFYPLVK